MTPEPETIRRAESPSRRRNSNTSISAMSTASSSARPSSRTSPALVLLLLLVCCLTYGPQYSHGYNIDLPSYIRHTREPNTMFGFSIALHRGKAGYPQMNSLIVGAPKYDTSAYQQGVLEAGAVFKCGMDDGDCNLVRFDSTGNRHNSNGDVIERKSHQWLGATISTSRDNDLVVACAPRFVFHTMTPTKTLRYDPVGTCFTSRNFTQFKEISPCRTSYWGYHRQGSCQAGFSAAASKTGDRLYIGAPGSWYWQGEAYSVSSDATFPYKPSFYQPFGTGGQSYSYDVTRPENQVFSTTESSSQDDDSYLGYSMVTGDFNGDGMDDIAIGMPRGAGLLGKIVVNGWNMANIFNITGRQIGEYFGYALASSDVDGDGLDDLIIGAPMFSEPGNAEGKYDVGRIYVLLQKSTNKANRWTEEFIRDGYNTKGRFGLSLASLGDINRDGYGDFAVGAPYDGPEGRGAVYIFHGSVNGPLQKPSQIIRSEDLIEGAPYPRTFGFSLSGGLDMDGNTYPDLAVGAYASDQVFIFKSRPVAAVNAVTNFINPSKLINLEEKQCQTVRDGKRVSCTDITTCWSYTGEYLPRSLEFDVSWVLDAKKPKNPRMFFILDEGKNIRNQSISLDYGKTYCRNETVYLIDNLQDKLTPLEVEMRYNLRSVRRLSPVVRRRREALEPVIDQNREIILRDAINIQKNCGLDNICEPDLRLEIKTVDKYLLGSREPLSIEVLISNFNEDAFEAAFYLVMPKDLDFKKIQQIGDKGDTPITCSAPSEANNNTLKCDIGNPLQRGKVANFNVVMLPSHKVGMAPSYDFFMEANSTNLEKLGSHFDNIIRKSIGIWVETDLAIEGTSLPDFQFYKASDYKAVENASKEEDLGPQVVHIYNIRNNGPSAIEEAVVLIHYPYQTVSGDLLMYLTNQPETDGRIRCDPHIAVNSRNLHLDRALKDKSYLEQIGAVVRTGGVSSTSSFRGVRIEQSQGGGGGGTMTFLNETKKLSAEEEKRLIKEDEQDVSGDASFIHSQRANAAAAAEANTHSASGGHASGSNGSWTWSSSWNSSTDGRAPSVVVSSKNTSVYYDSRGQPHMVESSTEYVKALDRSPSYHAQLSNYEAAGHNTGHLNAGVLNRPAVEKLSQASHNARGHIQMANPEGSANYQQSYSNYGNSGGSSGGAYRPNVQYNNTNRAASSGSVSLEKAAQGGHGFQAGMLDLGTLNRDNVGNEGGAAASSAAAYRPNVQYNNANRAASSGSVGLEKTAQGGHGFQAGMLDLGTMNRDNVDNELRDRGSQSYHEFHASRPQGGASYHASSYSSGGGGGSGGASGSKPYYGMENEDYYDEDGQQVPPQPQWTRTSSSTSHRRFRRAADSTEELSPLGSPCKAAKCETIRCVATNLGKDDGVWVAIRTRMVAKTMEKLASNVPLNVSTMAVSYVTRLPYIGEPKDEIIKSHEIFFKAEPEPIPVPDVVPLWVVVLAACAGALILLLLVFLLYKCGFFNRNRPTDHSQERQPLRNGYHGDEHL